MNEHEIIIFNYLATQFSNNYLHISIRVTRHPISCPITSLAISTDIAIQRNGHRELYCTVSVSNQARNEICTPRDRKEIYLKPSDLNPAYQMINASIYFDAKYCSASLYCISLILEKS